MNRLRHPFPLPLPRGQLPGEAPRDIQQAIDRDAKVRALELARTVQSRAFQGWPQIRAWLAVALQDASIGCAYGVGVLRRPMTREEQHRWLSEFFRHVPSASRIIDQAGQAQLALPTAWRELVWW